jgi:diadenosine tetraphosphate (Ap4A) HIT family hydrolase
MTDFALDPTLATDTTPVGDLGLSALLLARDARFPWLILVPRRAGLVEIIDLAPTDRAILMDEITAVSQALRATTGCDKLNVAALGNQVRQLHVHVIARFHGDPAWPRPIWGSGAPVAYEAAARDRLVAQLRESLSLT